MKNNFTKCTCSITNIFKILFIGKTEIHQNINNDYS